MCKFLTCTCLSCVLCVHSLYIFSFFFAINQNNIHLGISLLLVCMQLGREGVYTGSPCFSRHSDVRPKPRITLEWEWVHSGGLAAIFVCALQGLVTSCGSSQALSQRGLRIVGMGKWTELCVNVCVCTHHVCVCVHIVCMWAHALCVCVLVCIHTHCVCVCLCVYPYALCVWVCMWVFRYYACALVCLHVYVAQQGMGVGVSSNAMALAWFSRCCCVGPGESVHRGL